MGTFDLTCALSDIGISYGDRVVTFLIMKGETPYPHDASVQWGPITYGLHGIYDGYGYVDFDHKEDFSDHILNTLKGDIVSHMRGRLGLLTLVKEEELSFETITESDWEDKLFYSNNEEDGLRLSFAYVREDVFEELFPIDKDITEIASALKRLVIEFAELSKKFNYVDNIYTSNSMFGVSLSSLKHTLVEGSFLRHHGINVGAGDLISSRKPATDLMRSTPFDRQDLFIEWVRAFKMLEKANLGLRRGIRPSVRHVGSQFGSDDALCQLEYCKKLIPILEKIVEEDKEL